MSFDREAGCGEGVMFLLRFACEPLINVNNCCYGHCYGISHILLIRFLKFHCFTAVFFNTRPSRKFSQRPNVFLVDVNHLFLWQFKNARWTKNNLAVNLAPSEIMKKILREVLTTLLRFCVFLTDSKYGRIWIIAWKVPKEIARQRFYSLNRAWLHKLYSKRLKIRNANLF